ncbi:MAG: nuclear transport factor 2 family protein [Candidatus Heimdallarchaeota archaeon]|nr:nuclear transport factor 2 family protein [Candidatus Heimdallarchaeota archaeon]
MNVVDRQFIAFNNRNLDDFISCYDEDIEVFLLSNNERITSGTAELRSIMSKSFEEYPNANTEVISRIENGNMIINLEKIVNHGNTNEIHAISIYEISHNKIVRLWFGSRV